MDKAITFGALAFIATLLITGGSIYARETGKGNGFEQAAGFECPMHEAMENAGYTGMEEMHKAMHGNGTECPMMENAGKNFTGNFTSMEEMHEAMHGNSTGGCPMMGGSRGTGGMMQGNGMMGGSGMMQRGR